MVLLSALVMAMSTKGASAEDDPAFISLGVGYFDIYHQDESAADFRVEYRGKKLLWIIKPWAGVEFTSDGAFYPVGGLMFDVFLGRRLVLTPSAGVGAYFEGSGKDLGSTIEFRTQIELAYRFDDRSRLGLAFSHISNASIGDDNPGTEILSVYYSIPFGKVF